MTPQDRSSNPRRAIARSHAQAGYWFGGLSFLLSLFSLSLGLVPLVTTILTKPPSLQIPGSQWIELKLPGTYIAVGLLQGLPSQDREKIRGIEYFFSDESGKEVPEVLKFPPRNYAQEKEDRQVPLFQVVFRKKGKYQFASDYPIGIEGPKIGAILFNVDTAYIRSELTVGLILCLLFAGLGLYLIRRTTASENPRSR